MKKLISWICKMLGIETYYLVTAIHKDANGSISLLTYTCSVTPWIHIDIYKELLEYTQKQTKQDVVGQTLFQ
jgi:hypothetical protein